MGKSAFKKSDDELQIVWGEVYAPDIVDAQTDMMSAETVMKMAYGWMIKSATHCIDMEHDNKTINAAVVESFVARKGDPDFIEGAWVVGVHIADAEAWQKVKKGEINGFSLQGRASSGSRDVTMPADITGITKSAEEHTHNFTVAYSEDGAFIGGITDVVDGHYHVIRKGTVTEDAAGHRHQYDFVRGVLGATGGA